MLDVVAPQRSNPGFFETLLTTLSFTRRVPPHSGRRHCCCGHGEEEIRSVPKPVLSQSATRNITPLAAPRRLVAADVGGTHARVALVGIEHGSEKPVQVLQYEKYACADFPGLGAILQTFVATLGDTAVESGAIACAGYVLDGVIINPNLPWTVSLGTIRAELGLRSLEFVNDFEAAAYATQYLEAGDTTPLTPARSGVSGAPTLVVGPGTGLGAAVRIPTATGCVVLATEAGHAAFAPSTDREIEILRILRRKDSHVENERLLSGPGLVNTYTALCELRGVKAILGEPAAVTQAALDGTDPAAREALDVFCGLMGSVIGDLVCLYGPRGGVYLAGGILPRIKDYLRSSTFLERFLDKGAMRPVLERVPVMLVEHSQLGVLGAAGWYLARHGKE
jgi:glucokinase